MPLADLTDAFPVLRETAYLNAGTGGPIAADTAAAMREVLDWSTEAGRGLPYYEALGAVSSDLREAWGRLLNASPDELALTAGTSDGLARVLAMMRWSPGDEVITSDEEHPGLLGPLGALARREGVRVRAVPWASVAAEVSPSTKLVAVSHVSWLRGAVADLAEIGAAGAPVLVDGAQAAGAIPVDASALRHHGVVAYAASGQKWTCGPVGTGALWVDERWAPDRGVGVWPTYEALEDPARGLQATAWPSARRFDAPSLGLELQTGSLAALTTLERQGWEAVHTAGVAQAEHAAVALREAGAHVLDRGPSTLVGWRSPNPEAELARAASANVVIRGFPGLPYVRASVGAWTTDEHVARLVAAVAGR